VTGREVAVPLENALRTHGGFGEVPLPEKDLGHPETGFRLGGRQLKCSFKCLPRLGEIPLAEQRLAEQKPQSHIGGRVLNGPAESG
jgi:hypothetical protein